MLIIGVRRAVAGARLVAPVERDLLRARQARDLGAVEAAVDEARRRVVEGRAVEPRLAAGDGDRATQAMRGAIAAVEDRWRDEVGAARYATFREVLAELVERLPAADEQDGAGPVS